MYVLAVGSTCVYHSWLRLWKTFLANDAPMEQAPAVAPPTRTDDQILPLTNGCPSTRATTCQLDEQWFNLHKDILRDALYITPTNDNNPFVAPPSSDIIIEYVNTLGYPSTLRNVSDMSVNALYRPWRDVLSMINMCLTGKTVGYDRPRHIVLSSFWWYLHHSILKYAERIWEEFVQSIQTFLIDWKNLATTVRGKKKTAHLLILSVRFTKLIIDHMRTKHNIHPRTGSPLHYSHEESILNTLRFVGKDGREIFGMSIPDAILSDAIIRSTLNLRRYPRACCTVINNLWMLNVARLRKEEQQKYFYAPKGPARPMVLREPNSGKYQPLLKVQGKGKEKVVDETVPHDYTPHFTTSTKKRPSTLTDSVKRNQHDDIKSMINAGDQDEGQARPNPESQPQPIHGVHAGPNREHVDLEAIDASSQQKLEQIDEEFTTTAYLNKSLELDYSNQGLADQEEARKKKRKKCKLKEPPLVVSTLLCPLPQPPYSWVQYGAPGQFFFPTSFDVVNNWASALATTYEPPAENSLLAKIGDMTTFLRWYCLQVNKTTLTQVDLEGQAYEVVKAFYPDVIHLQFQM
ncbi:hypothetical protein Tco_1228923 [Tanacetum coccineum]